MSRGQAALEFLTTYGWAILVILVMIGAISYFGVARPATLLPDKCATSPDFSCADYKIGDTKAYFQLRQGVGKTIYVESFSCTLDGEESAVSEMEGSALAPGTAWSPREDREFTCGDYTQFPGLVGEKVKVFFTLAYRTSPDGFLHLATGELYTEVQE